MGMNAFIEIKDIPGESTDSAHEGWISVEEFSLGVSQAKSPVSGSGALTNSQATFQDFSFDKPIDISSPALMEACAKGKHFPEISVDVCRAGDTEMKVIQSFKFSNCIISSWNQSGNGDEVIKENVSIAYGKIFNEYKAQENTQIQNKGQKVGGWDLERHEVFAG